MTGLSAERMQQALQQEKRISPEDHAKVRALAGMVKMPRSFIFNHALPMCRAGYPGHLGAPWGTSSRQSRSTSCCNTSI